MNSVERVVQYSSDVIEQEAPHEKDDPKPPKNWPLKGSITFRNVFMNYRPGLPAVLKGISLNIRPREKIGVVGRYVSSQANRDTFLSRPILIEQEPVKYVFASGAGVHINHVIFRAL